MMTQENEITEAMKQSFKNTLCNLQFQDPSLIKGIESLNDIEKWDSYFANALFSGRMILRNQKSDRKFFSFVSCNCITPSISSF